MATLEPCKPIFWWFIEDRPLRCASFEHFRFIGVSENEKNYILKELITTNNEMNTMLIILTRVWWEQGVIWAYQIQYSLPVQLCSTVQLCHIPLCSLSNWHWLTKTYSIRPLQPLQSISTHSETRPVCPVTSDPSYHHQMSNGFCH